MGKHKALQEREKQGEKIQKEYQVLRILNSLEKLGNRRLFLVLRGSLTTVKRTSSTELRVGFRRKSPEWGENNAGEGQRSPTGIQLFSRLETWCAVKMTELRLGDKPSQFAQEGSILVLKGCIPGNSSALGKLEWLATLQLLLWHLALSRFSVFKWMKKGLRQLTNSEARFLNFVKWG